MPLRLADNLSWCVCAGRPIFLDLEADRYFCLSPRLELAFERWRRPTADGAHDDCLDLLVRRGFLVPDPQAGERVPSPAFVPPTRDLLDRNRRSSLRDVVQILAAEISAQRRLRRRPLAEIVEQCRTSRPPSTLAVQQARSGAERIAAAFERSGLFLGAADRCLARALAAMIICHARGIYPALVFGVRVNPFAAHSWVQIADSVVVGDFEQVRLFTPILLVQ